MGKGLKNNTGCIVLGQLSRVEIIKINVGKRLPTCAVFEPGLKRENSPQTTFLTANKMSGSKTDGLASSQQKRTGVESNGGHSTLQDHHKGFQPPQNTHAVNFELSQPFLSQRISKLGGLYTCTTVHMISRPHGDVATNFAEGLQSKDYIDNVCQRSGLGGASASEIWRTVFRKTSGMRLRFTSSRQVKTQH